MALFALLPLPWASCSSSKSEPKCDPSQCAPHNDCVDDGSGKPSCRLVCTQQSDCPYGYYCNDGRPKSWCAEMTFAFTKADGQWGTPCMPPKEEGNPACDSADAFACYGISPTDANAFCTQLGCRADSDCQGGWWCATLNAAPNVTTAKASFGKPPRPVCVPRSYCAPCQLDHDCPMGSDGRPQYCQADSQGNMYCTSRCSPSTGCAADAKCVPHFKLCLGGAGATAPQACTRDEDCPPSARSYAQHCDFSGGVGPSAMGFCAPECGSNSDCDSGQQCQNSGSSYCTPRAGVCKGDGSLCSPCRSDADCTNGDCVYAEYSTERFCSSTAKGVCPSNAPPAAGMCPAKTGAPQSGVGCVSAPAPGMALPPTSPPVNQCVGVVDLGGAGVLGCWSAH